MFVQINAEHFGPPLNLQYAHLTSTSVTITWSSPWTKNNSVHIVNYLISVYSYEIQDNIVCEHHSTTHYQVRSLHPDYHYKIKVSVVTDNNVSGPVAAQDVQTSEDG